MQNCSYVQIAISLAAVSHVLQTWNEGSDIVSVFLQLSEKKSVIVVSMIQASWVKCHIIHVLWENVVFYLTQGSTNFLNI